MLKYINKDISTSKSDHYSIRPIDRIAEHYPYTLESAGRSDFYPDWSSSPSRKSKAAKKLAKLKRNIRAVEETFGQLNTDNVGEHSIKEDILEQFIA